MRKKWRRVGENNRWMRKYSSLANPSMATPLCYNLHLPLWQLTQFSILINLHWKTNINSTFGCLKSHPYSWSLWCNYTSYWSTMASHDHRRSITWIMILSYSYIILMHLKVSGIYQYPMPFFGSEKPDTCHEDGEEFGVQWWCKVEHLTINEVDVSITAWNCVKGKKDMMACTILFKNRFL